MLAPKEIRLSSRQSRKESGTASPVSKEVPKNRGESNYILQEIISPQDRPRRSTDKSHLPPSIAQVWGQLLYSDKLGNYFLGHSLPCEVHRELQPLMQRAPGVHPISLKVPYRLLSFIALDMLHNRIKKCFPCDLVCSS